MWNKKIITKAAQIEGKCEKIRSASTFGDLLFSTKDKGDRRRVSFGDLPFWLETAEGEVPCRSYIRRGAAVWYCTVLHVILYGICRSYIPQRDGWCDVKHLKSDDGKVWYGGAEQGMVWWDKADKSNSKDGKNNLDLGNNFSQANKFEDFLGFQTIDNRTPGLATILSCDQLLFRSSLSNVNGQWMSGAEREVLRQQEQARTEIPALDLGSIEDCPRSLTYF